MTYLDMAKAVKVERGRTLAHPWRGLLVDSPKGRGRLVWTDGYRAAISRSPDLALLVDLADVTLVEETK